MRVLAAFVFVASVSAILTLALAALDESFWPVACLCVAVGWSISKVRPLERIAPWLALCFGGAFLTALLSSIDVPVAGRSAQAWLGSTAIAAAIGLVAALAALGTAEPKTRPALPWIFLCLAMGAAVGWFSGDRGSADPMRFRLYGWFSAQIAEIILWVVRKTIHVVFYGVAALLFYRGSRAAGDSQWLAALVFAVSLGAFDEYRQGSTPSRIGTPFDILFDAGGALLMLRLAGAFGKRRPAPK